MFADFLSPLDPSDDHASVGIGARRVAGRFVNGCFLVKRLFGFALVLDVVSFEVIAGLLLQILGSCFAEAEMLPRIFFRLLVIVRISEAIRQIRFLTRGTAVQRVKNLSPVLLLQ